MQINRNKTKLLLLFMVCLFNIAMQAQKLTIGEKKYFNSQIKEADAIVSLQILSYVADSCNGCILERNFYSVTAKVESVYCNKQKNNNLISDTILLKVSPSYFNVSRKKLGKVMTFLIILFDNSSNAYWYANALVANSDKNYASVKKLITNYNITYHTANFLNYAIDSFNLTLYQKQLYTGAIKEHEVGVKIDILSFFEDSCKLCVPEGPLYIVKAKIATVYFNKLKNIMPISDSITFLASGALVGFVREKQHGVIVFLNFINSKGKNYVPQSATPNIYWSANMAISNTSNIDYLKNIEKFMTKQKYLNNVITKF